MLVTFKTSAYSDITLFGKAAASLLKLMGQSGNVPGAIMASDIPDALEKLKAALAQSADSTNADDAALSASLDASGFSDKDKEPFISLEKRAGPLISLLEAAAAANENVLWDH